MKKVLIPVFVIMMVLVVKAVNAQVIPTYPIPSFNVKVIGYANFRQDYHSNSKSTREKRNVQVNITSANPYGCTATVWIYSLDHTTVLGPFTVTCGQTLTVPIDDRQWGVLVESEEEVVVDVWIETGDSSNIQGATKKRKNHTIKSTMHYVNLAQPPMRINKFYKKFYYQ
ncbi:MAG: hypothetical protein EOM90_04835 [Alphaproteobacteria bacterium]|nr:hypothetical protein [Alphaproteobacteria bacterium]